MIFGQIGSSLGISYAQEVQAEETESEYVGETVDASASNAEKYGLAENTKDGVILHAFCWSFNTIKENMKDIAEAGYTTVQTSPANACNDSYPTKALWDLNQVWNTQYDGKQGAWWWHYQPTDWTIGNYQLGSAEDYKAMCEEADKYGVKIITDVIPNHTANDTSKVSSNLINAAGGNLYHSNGFNEIQNSGDWSWGNRLACTTGMMGGLPDVDTENQGFQAYYLKYCNDLIALGCDGFRYDTAKHIGVPSDPKDANNTRGVNDFWDVATGKKAVNGVSLSNKDNLFIYGEVLQGDNVPTSEYANYMEQTASDYGWTLREAVKNKNFSVGTISNWKHSDPDKIVTWVESHDTYMNNHESAFLTNDQIKMAWALITARKDGTPLFLSRPDGSDGASGNYYGNNVLGAKGNDHFKDPEVVAVNKFRTAMIGQGEYLRNPNGNSQILQIDRGELGTCIINLGGSTSINSETTMADGTYTDQVSGREFTVSNGKISGQLDSYKVAVIYDPAGNTKPKITASKADGSTFTTDTIDVTFTVKNAATASYTIDNGESVPFTDSVTLTLGADTAYGDTVAVRIDVTTEDGLMTGPVFSYTKKEAGKLEKNTVYFTKPADWSDAKIYAYIPNGENATKLTGDWTGSAMTDEGNGVYSYTFGESVDSCKVIFNDGKTENGQQTPANEQGKACGYDYEKGYAFTYNETDKWVKVSVVDPTATPTATNTPTPVEEPSIEVSLADGSSFSTETATVKITLKNAEAGMYCVDGGPVKTFSKSTEVVIGQGKIADSEVTLKVSTINAPGGPDREIVEKTYTYKKEYVAGQSSTPLSKGSFPVQDLDVEPSSADAEAEVEEVTVNAASNTSLASQYATNAKGVGVKKTITVDKSVDDWDSSMLIAQGAANDDPRVYCTPNSMFEVPIDAYALHGAYDDNNLYLMWEMTNVQDVVAPGDNYPLTQGVLYQTQNLPFFIAIDTGKSDVIGNKGQTTTGGTIRGSGLTIESSFNRLIAISTNGSNGPYVYGGDSTGLNAVEIHSKAGGGEAGAKKSGIQFGYGMGIVSSSINGIDGGYGKAHNRVVGDVCDDSADWVEFNAKGHSSATMDFHYEIAIPFEELGVTASDVQSNGFGVLLVSTFGTSGMDCLPYDVSMNDNADQPDTESLPENSFEKSDADNVTCTFARIGNGDIPTITPPVKPTATPTPTVEATTVPTVSVAATPSVEPTATPVPTSDLHVNFGAEVSSPQYNSREITLEALAGGGTGVYVYEFYIDDVKVENDVFEQTYKWKYDTEGTHKIKVIVTDTDGNRVASEKEFVLESDGTVIPVTPTPIVTATPTPIITTAPPTTTPTPLPDSGLTVRDLQASSMEVKVGEEVEFSVLAYSGDYGHYPINVMFTYVDPDTNEEVVIKKYDREETATYAFDKAGTYTIKAYGVSAKTGNVVMTKLEGFTVVAEQVVTPTVEPTVTPTAAPTITPIAPTAEPTATTTPTPTEKPVEPTKKPTATPTQKPQQKLQVKSLKTSVKSNKAHVGNTIRLTATATGGTGTLKYQFTYKYNGKTKVIKSYSTKNTANFKPKKAGKYTLTVNVKDASGKVVSKSVKSYKVKEKLGVKKMAITYKSGKLKVKTTVQGAEKNVKYKYVLKRNGKKIKATSYKSSKTVTFKNVKKGKYSITVYVKDSTKKVAKKTISYKVK